MPSREVCEERVAKAGRVGVYDANSRDWTAGIALADKLFPEYKN